MKFREILFFEFAYQLRRISTWLIFAALTVIAFLMTRDGSLAEALHDDFFLNSPFSVAKTTVAGSLIWLLAAAGVTGEAAARDIATRMYLLTYTSGVSRVEYLGGRFVAAFFLNALILLAVQAGILLAVYLPGVNTAVIGPFRLAAYLNSYAIIALPNALIATSIQFLLATRSGRPMAAYLGSVFLFFMSYIVGLFLLFQGRQDLANLLDPIGVHFILSELSHLWTPVEKSTRLIELEGTVLTNRLLWLGIGLVVLAATFLSFTFTHRRQGTGWRPFTRRRNLQAPILPGILHPESGSGTQILRLVSSKANAGQIFSVRFHVRQTIAFTRDAFRTIVKSWAGLFMLVAIPAMTVLVVLDQMEINGVPLIPKTGRVLSELTAPLVADMSRWVIIPLLIIFYAGQLVWRERDAGLGEITDVMPGSEWPPFLGKFLGLAGVLLVFMVCLVMAGMTAQAIMGYHDFEASLYLEVLLGLQLPEYLLFALLALVVHGLVNHKYIGYLVAIIAYLFITLASLFGIEHNLLIYGAGPAWTYTEMSGFGPSLGPWLWFKLYWSAWAVLLAVVARLFWVRGRENSFKARRQLARVRFTPATARMAIAATGLVLVFGGFIFYNTNVLNEYLPASGLAERRAGYERLYAKYAGMPQPTLTGTNLHVEIYPALRKVDIRGSYKLVNRSTGAIDSIHLAIAHGVETGRMVFDRTAALVVADEDRGHRIYTLDQALMPGDSLQLDFQVHFAPRGFSERGVDASVTDNGTFFASGDWLPAIGYQRSRELTSAADRRAQGLPPHPLIASLYDVEARKERGGRIAFDAVIGTDTDQLAVAPGVLRREWTERRRRYFHYTTDTPIENGQFFFSARYTVHKAQWNDPAGTGKAVAVRIYHDPRHTANLDRMVKSVKASLDYYTSQFGPYGYSQISFIEHPGDGDGAGIHAVASMLIYEEGFSFWDPKDDAGSLDHPFAVVAHEVAHQWTVPYANVEGAPVLSESLAWYYGMKVVENARGRQQLDRLRHFMRQPHPYPPIRRGEPLLRGLDPYLSYRKGPFALYALSEYIGEQRVNAALRRLVERHFPQQAPLATTLDLYRELQAVTPDSLQYLLHDLFEVNTYWELKAGRASAKQTTAGTWQVVIDVEARKMVADSAGVETVRPLNDWIQIGVFEPAGAGDHPGKPLYLKQHLIDSRKQTITVTVPRRPAQAGIDPNYLLIDLETGDNMKEVKIEN